MNSNPNPGDRAIMIQFMIDAQKIGENVAVYTYEGNGIWISGSAQKGFWVSESGTTRFELDPS